MLFKSLLLVPAFMIAIGMSLPTWADDTIPTDIQQELAEAKRSLRDAIEHLRRVEAKIADLNRDTPLDELDRKDFVWRVLGLRLEETDGKTIRDANEAARTKYRGAMQVTAVRTNGPADSQSIRPGDLLLGVDGMQTINNADMRAIARRESEMVTEKKVKFYILRNGQTLFGHFDLTQP